MSRIAWISWGLVGVAALLHVGFMGMEIFKAAKVAADVAKLTPELITDKTKPLIWNQGLYNGFLAAGLFWSLCGTRPNVDVRLATFFLVCVLIAGVFGGLTIQRPNLYL